ncbi:hypothetical protein JW707_00020 [Candidatus Woesearchaeota archaeon]|nr:hypothetical protein [Candidatus Woesearchaeota archaeon]
MKSIVIPLLFLLAAPFASAAECNISIFLETDNNEFDNGDKIEFSPKLSSSDFDYVIEYWIEDSDGSIVKQKINTTNQNKKSFTAKNIGKNIVLKARIADLGCEDISPDDNLAEKTIFLKGKSADLANKSVTVSFSVDKNTQKLADFSSGMNKTESNTPETGSNDKLRKAAPYFLLALTTLISIALIWKR